MPDRDQPPGQGRAGWGASVAANRRRKHIVGAAIAVIMCVVLAGGCTRPISGVPPSAGNSSTTTVAGLPAANGPSGPKPGAADAALPVDNGDGGPRDKLAANAVADIQ